METITEQNRWKVSKALDMTFGEPYIRGKYGIIRQISDGNIDVWATNRRISIRLEKTWKAKQHYDDGALFIRPFSDLDTACLILKCRKRRKVTDKMREAGKRLSEYQKTRFQLGERSQ